MQTQNLGELNVVSNTLREHKFEADELVVGWVMVDGDVRQVAFTPRELLRPMDRAKTNREDLPTLGPLPPTHQQMQDLVDENAKLSAKLHAVLSRGLFDRILNTGGDDAD
jgi:hypothetical protein